MQGAHRHLRAAAGDAPGGASGSRMIGRSLRWFGALRTTTKFGLSFSLMLTIIVMEMIVGYAALADLADANKALQQSAEIQRLAMTIGRNWESARRLQKDFFLQSDIVGAGEAYSVQAMASASKITEVIRDGALLKRTIAASSDGSASRERMADLDLILSTVSRYATTYQMASELELGLNSYDGGLHAQLESVSARISALLTGAREHETLVALYYELRFFDESAPGRTGAATAAALRLREALERSSLPPDGLNEALAALARYEQLAADIARTDAQVQDQLATLAQLGNVVEPSLVTLLATVNTEAGQARLRFEQTRLSAVSILAATVMVGLLLAMAVAAVLHITVTRQVTRLTEVAGRLQGGDLDARSALDRGDELGHLAATLNAMAAKLGLTIDRMEIVRKASLDLASELDADSVMDRTLEVSTSLSGAEIGFVGLASGDALYLARSIGTLRSGRTGDQLPCDVEMLANKIMDRQTTGQLTPEPAIRAGGLLPADYTCVAIPLVSAYNTMGVLVLAARDPDVFSVDTLQFLELYATSAAVAIHNALLYENVQQLALVDSLTGLYNRRGLFQFSQQPLETALRAGQPGALIFLDIDNFKAFNDCYSYDAGDQVLEAIAAHLRESVPAPGIACRYGGEEFVVVLPGMNLVEATALAETLRCQVAAAPIATDAGRLATTISLGVTARQPAAVAPSPGSAAELLDDLITRAGRLLHAAKESGRNCIVAEDGCPGSGAG